MLAAGLQALGANVEPLPLPEVTQALQNGTIDGVEANLPLIYTSQWYEQAKNVTGNVNFWPFPTVLVINKAVYDGLTADQQTALTDAAANITANSIKIFTTPGSTVAQDLANCGVKYLTATDADKAALAKAAQSAIANLAPESQDFVTQIQDLAKTLPAPAAPPPLPTTKTGDASRPPGRLDLGPARTRGCRNHADPAPAGAGSVAVGGLSGTRLMSTIVEPSPPTASSAPARALSFLARWVEVYSQAAVGVARVGTAVAVALAILAVAGNVFTRNVLGYSLFGSDELARFAFLWAIWLGVSLGDQAGLGDRRSPSSPTRGRTGGSGRCAPSPGSAWPSC